MKHQLVGYTERDTVLCSCDQEFEDEDTLDGHIWAESPQFDAAEDATWGD